MLHGLTTEKLPILREVIWDMNLLSGFPETVPNEEDNPNLIKISNRPDCTRGNLVCSVFTKIKKVAKST